MNYKYRPQLLERISGVILIGDKDKYMKASLSPVNITPLILSST